MQEAGNQREFSRVEVEIAAQLVTDGGTRVDGKLHDISLNGACIESEASLAVGDTCGVDVILGQEGEEKIVIHAEGKVVRRLSSSLAISFESVDSDGFPHLQNLVLYNAGDVAHVQEEFSSHVGIKAK